MEISGTNVILHGVFEPHIFHPSWLFHHGAESNDFANSYQLDIFSDDIAKYKIDATEYYIDRAQFIISSEKVSLTDLINNQLSKIFCQLVPFTQVYRFSILKYVHIKLKNSNEWIKLNAKLAPLRLFGDIAHGVKKSGEKFQTGLYTMQLCASEKAKDFKFMKYITVGMSSVYQNSKGVYLSEEFQYFDEQYQDAAKFVDITKSELDDRIKEAENTFQTIRELI